MSEYAILTADLYRHLKDRPCADCGKSFPPECMDFDHLPGLGKSFNISKAIFSRSRSEVLAEIEKCDLVCACCHRIRTAERGSRFDTHSRFLIHWSYYEVTLAEINDEIDRIRVECPGVTSCWPMAYEANHHKTLQRALRRPYE